MNDRIAIVGTGISGLTAAYLLSRRHELVVYEADRRIGGHSHTVEVADGAGTHGVDTGFIVYNRRTYPAFCRLLDQLGVATQPSDMSFSYRDDAADLEYGAPEPWRLFAQPRNLVRPAHWRMLGEILRFYREAPRLLEAAERDTDLTLADYLATGGYDRAFVEQHLYPVTAAIWSSRHAGMGEYPAAALVRFFRNHGLLSLTDRPRWRTITGGSRRYVETLTRPFREAIRPGSPVTRIERDASGVTVHAPTGPPERFDQVVLACHADQALPLLESPTRAEETVLAAFPYAEAATVLHSDTSVMPRRRAAWASWNYLRVPAADERVVMTYDQNRLQRLRTRRPYLVTLNHDDALAADLVHARMTYHHPQYDREAVRMQSEIEALNGQNRTYYCGAYWGYGFHEDGVASGLRVARAFGEEL
ncbi:FAD-dependent oxidoreductase [bacterium]|nr:FAD-dependent oxidoreductase [bacterium]